MWRVIRRDGVPLDDERRAEAEVWWALAARAQTDESLAGLRDRSYDDLRELCRLSVESLAGSGGLRPGLDRALEVERLYAVLDGLALHGLTRPDALPPERARAVLRCHVRDLLTVGGLARDTR